MTPWRGSSNYSPGGTLCWRGNGLMPTSISPALGWCLMPAGISIQFLSRCGTHVIQFVIAMPCAAIRSAGEYFLLISNIISHNCIWPMLCTTGNDTCISIYVFAQFMLGICFKAFKHKTCYPIGNLYGVISMFARWHPQHFRSNENEGCASNQMLFSIALH